MSHLYTIAEFIFHIHVIATIAMTIIEKHQEYICNGEGGTDQQHTFVFITIWTPVSQLGTYF